MATHVLAIDQGTTSSRAILFDHGGQAVSMDQREFQQIYPQPGHVEHDPEEIWSTQHAVARKALAKAGVDPTDLAAIGVTNQRETTVLWERDSGRPVGNAIVWQSRVTAPLCDRLKADGLEPTFRSKTGLLLDAYFSGTKIKYLLDQTPGLRERAERGEILFGTIDSFLIWRMSGGRLHVTDPSNASRTLLYNIHTQDWDDELLQLLDVPRKMLPALRGSSEILGETDPSFLGHAVPIGGVAGDQQAATFGQACFSRGSAKNTYGTGCFLLLNTGTAPVASEHGLITTVGWKIGDQITYCLEGSIFIGGAVIQWLRDELGLISSSAESEFLARSVESTDGVYVVPAFVGLGAPYWDSSARGTIVGLTRGSNRAHLVRAALESIAYQSRDVLEAMQADAGLDLAELKVDGGVSANNLLMQFQADLLGVPVVRPAVQETTALGAAYLAGLAVGFWRDLDDVAGHWKLDQRFDPAVSHEAMDSAYAGWKQAVRQARV